MDQPAESLEGPLAQSIQSLETLLAELGMDRSLIDLDRLSYHAGIPRQRVAELLEGHAPPQEAPAQEIFRQRLNFLRETRRKDDGKRLTQDEIGEGACMSHGQVGFLLNGQRSPGMWAVSALEKFFHVPAGFLTASEEQALDRALKPVLEQLLHLAVLKGRGISALAMRSTSDGAGHDQVGRELRTALAQALSAPPDDDVRELAQQVGALPPKSRNRVIPAIRRILGREQRAARGPQPEDDE
ncbi:helix-turn-helix transcriptional regulator [Streptomyces sp. NPDC006906]|uniref:helix-turn-helix domain-containing protein n=1 Tax=unclassified Streptomyces TaxID=2593676 RepID=UPI0033FC0B10